MFINNTVLSLTIPILYRDIGLKFADKYTD
jgi:hypothetical protein